MNDLPPVKGQVKHAPEYIRVRPGWVEKALLVAVFVQIMLVLWMIAYGSTAARAARDASLYNRKLLCDIVYRLDPAGYQEHIRDCPPR